MIFTACSALTTIAEVKQLLEVPIRTTVVAVLLSLFALLSAGFAVPDLSDFNSGAEKLGSGDYRGALLDFNKAIELNPEDPESFSTVVLQKQNQVTFRVLFLITTRQFN